MMLNLKRNLLQVLKKGQIFQKVAESDWRSQRLLILCYHGISIEDEHEWKPSFSMTKDDFEARLEVLRSGGYSVLPLDEALKRLYTKTLPEKSVVITFDDGLYNFYAHAWPLLQSYGFPATLYLTTYYCYHNLPVFPLICSYLIWKRRGVMLPPKPSLGLEDQVDLTTEAGRMRAWKDVQSYAQRNHFTAIQKNDLAEALADYLQLDFDDIVTKRLCHLMTPDEIREISKQGLDVQMHTHRHRSPMDPLLFQKEISENRQNIEALTGTSPLHHCYPSGVHRPPFLPWLSEQHVASATTCEPGFAGSPTHPLLLPRFLDASNVSPIEFESWLTGVGAFMPMNPFRHKTQNGYNEN